MNQAQTAAEICKNFYNVNIDSQRELDTLVAELRKEMSEKKPCPDRVLELYAKFIHLQNLAVESLPNGLPDEVYLQVTSIVSGTEPTGDNELDNLRKMNNNLAELMNTPHRVELYTKASKFLLSSRNKAKFKKLLGIQ